MDDKPLSKAAVASRKWRAEHPEHRERGRERAARYERHRSQWQALKARIGCQNCGENEPVCLEIHHTEERAKIFKTRQGFSGNLGLRRERLIEELRGCVVLYANCHRKVTYLGLDVSHIISPDFTAIWAEV